MCIRDRINSDGYFLRGWNDWNVWHDRVAVTPSADSVLERLLATESPQTLIIIDHVENVHYFGSPSLPRFMQIRRSLEICQVFVAETLAWRVKLNDNNSVGIANSTATEFIEYWDNVNGVEGTIREDFILDRDDLTELVRCQFSGLKFPERFCYLCWAYVFYEELAKEAEIPPGHSESKSKW